MFLTLGLRITCSDKKNREGNTDSKGGLEPGGDKELYLIGRIQPCPTGNPQGKVERKRLWGVRADEAMRVIHLPASVEPFNYSSTIAPLCRSL